MCGLHGAGGPLDAGRSPPFLKLVQKELCLYVLHVLRRRLLYCVIVGYTWSGREPGGGTVGGGGGCHTSALAVAPLAPLPVACPCNIEPPRCARNLLLHNVT